ncbi:MAG: hypothetical protein ACJ8IR_10430 [Alphaproteobacteria bacterium]
MSSVAKAFFYMGGTLLALIFGALIGISTNPFVTAVAPLLLPHVGQTATKYILIFIGSSVGAVLWVLAFRVIEKWAKLIDKNSG